MSREDAGRFLAAAERDYEQRIWRYHLLMAEEDGPDEEEVREARADVLAAQQVLLLAREEARGVGRRGVEEEVACPHCGRVVNRAFLFDSAARGVKWCAGCDAGAGAEEGQ